MDLDCKATTVTTGLFQQAHVALHQGHYCLVNNFVWGDHHAGHGAKMRLPYFGIVL